MVRLSMLVVEADFVQNIVIISAVGSFVAPIIMFVVFVASRASIAVYIVLVVALYWLVIIVDSADACI